MAAFTNDCKGIFFAFYAWNAGPVDWTDIAWSVLDIGTELSCIIGIQPERSVQVTLEGQQVFYYFKST